VGLLGSRWFRITSADAISDPALRTALRRLDPDREILAILPDDVDLRSFRRFASTHRMTVSLGELDR
jgi:hypothetical protein